MDSLSLVFSICPVFLFCILSKESNLHYAYVGREDRNENLSTFLYNSQKIDSSLVTVF